MNRLAIACLTAVCSLPAVPSLLVPAAAIAAGRPSAGRSGAVSTGGAGAGSAGAAAGSAGAAGDVPGGAPSGGGAPVPPGTGSAAGTTSGTPGATTTGSPGTATSGTSGSGAIGTSGTAVSATSGTGAPGSSGTSGISGTSGAGGATSGASGAGSVSGAIAVIDGPWFTVAGAGGHGSVLAALTQAADAVTAADLPYVWGGGHAAAGVPSAAQATGSRRATPIGYDCSGAVAAVLAGAGLWPSLGGVPADNGVIDQLLGAHLIARGAGRGAGAVTLYDDPGVHIFMQIDGRFFGTSDGGNGNAAQSNDGAGWLDDGAADATNASFHAYHVLASVLGAPTSYQALTTLRAGSAARVVSELGVGRNVTVTYSSGSRGFPVASSVQTLG